MHRVSIMSISNVVGKLAGVASKSADVAVQILDNSATIAGNFGAIASDITAAGAVGSGMLLRNVKREEGKSQSVEHYYNLANQLDSEFKSTMSNIVRKVITIKELSLDGADLSAKDFDTLDVADGMVQAYIAKDDAAVKTAIATLREVFYPTVVAA